MMAVHITNLIIISCHNNKCLILHLFQCKLCDKKFGYKISLQEHISSIHERSEVHSCDECGATYSRFRGLRRHLAAKHGNQLRKSKELPIQNQPNTDEKEAENVLMIKNTDGSVFLCNWTVVTELSMNCKQWGMNIPIAQLSSRRRDCGACDIKLRSHKWS